MSTHPIHPTAQQLHNEARALGQSGQYDGAIQKLEAAIALEPNWAYPVYDLAFTWFLKGDSFRALEYYRRTVELEPKGFFTSKTALYTLEGEASGKFPAGLYMAYLQIEWTNDAAKKFEIASALTANIPEFAPAWKELALLLEDTRQRMAAINTGLSKDPDADTKGILLLNKALLLQHEGSHEAATHILHEMIASPETTTANIQLAKMVMENKQ